MCGISGVVAVEGVLDPAIRRAMPAMNAELSHRGPDGEGFFDHERAVLGHRRLAIIDRATGAQPIANEDESCWIVFNGEIYNHRALREQLIARGHRFRTASDTETILHAYEEYGVDCVSRFEGMFVFALYDRARHELFIARDRLGKKPLFYALFNGVLHFASEVAALRRSPAWDGTIDPSFLESYLSLGYILAPQTVFRHVKKLEPAHWLRLINGRLTVQRYWDVTRFDDDGREAPALQGDLDRLLRQTVTERLESEVPLGAFLSGGIDSGLVVSYMAETVAHVETATVGFSDHAHNELAPAKLTADAFHTNHHADIVEPNLADVLDPIVRSFDEPFADASAVPTYYLSQIARRYVTVALSGDGGDESFAGYDFRYAPHAVEHRVRSVVPGAIGGLIGQVGRVWPRHRNLPRWLRLGTVLENISRDPAGAYYWDLCFAKPDVVYRMLGRSEPFNPASSAAYEAVTAPYRRCPSPGVVQKAQYADVHVYLPNDVLVKVDRMSMAHSLEVRCPLLDHKIVEFAFRVPTEGKMPGLRGKYLLRELAARRLPSQLSNLPKHGFTAPVGRWLKGPFASTFRDEVLSPRSHVSSLLDLDYLRCLFETHCAGRADNAYPLWAAWMLERWSRVHAAS